MKKLSIYLCSMLMAFAVSCSQPEPQVAPESSNTSTDANARVAAQKALETTINGTANGVAFSGVLRIFEFVEKNGKVYARAKITKLQGLSKNENAINKINGKVFELQVVQARVQPNDFTNISNPQQASREFSVQFASAQQATCDILNLVLGPLDLNLLGLEIHLDTVVLDIIANPAGGLLGQLLCAVANLLSGGLLLGELFEFIQNLNDIIDFLGSL